jgi:hypothetical protein
MNRDKLKQEIKKKVMELLKMDEESITGSGATFSPGAEEQYAANAAYNPDRKAKGTARNYLKTKWHWKEVPSIPNRPSKAIDYKQLFQEELNENYNRFRNETKTRSKSEQYHKAILEVKKRTNELNKLLEYAVRLKEEINQVDEIKSSRHTLNALDKVTETIKEVYIKAKKLK